MHCSGLALIAQIRTSRPFECGDRSVTVRRSVWQPASPGTPVRSSHSQRPTPRRWPVAGGVDDVARPFGGESGTELTSLLEQSPESRTQTVQSLPGDPLPQLRQRRVAVRGGIGHSQQWPDPGPDPRLGRRIQLKLADRIRLLDDPPDRPALRQPGGRPDLCRRPPLHALPRQGDRLAICGSVHRLHGDPRLGIDGRDGRSGMSWGRAFVPTGALQSTGTLVQEVFGSQES